MSRKPCEPAPPDRRDMAPAPALGAPRRRRRRQMPNMHEPQSMLHQSMPVLHASQTRGGDCTMRSHICGSGPRPFDAVATHEPESRSRASACSAPVSLALRHPGSVYMYAHAAQRTLVGPDHRTLVAGHRRRALAERAPGLYSRARAAPSWRTHARARLCVLYLRDLSRARVGGSTRRDYLSRGFGGLGGRRRSAIAFASADENASVVGAPCPGRASSACTCSCRRVSSDSSVHICDAHMLVPSGSSLGAVRASSPRGERGASHGAPSSVVDSASTSSRVCTSASAPLPTPASAM